MKHAVTVLLLLLLFGKTNGQSDVVHCTSGCGMVSSSSELASQIGAGILHRGGNAVDASIATAFALCVTLPAAGNIGGGGFMLYANTQGDRHAIDFRETAPAAAHAQMFLDSSGAEIDGLNDEGVLASGIPGTVAGLWLAHQRYGSIAWKELIQPAIALAREGITVTNLLHDESVRYAEEWRRHSSTARVMLHPDGSVMQAGEIWIQPELAATLERIANHGRDGFYMGETAERLSAFVQAQGGIISTEDLASYDAVERQPVVGSYREHEIISMPPPSSGGTALIEMLNMLEPFDVNRLSYHGTAHIHLLREVMNRAFLDRAAFLADTDFENGGRINALQEKSHAELRMKSFHTDSISVSRSSDAQLLYEGGEHTTHFSVVDEWGTAVALTYTIENSYGCKVIADGLGFFLNNEMGDFNPQPGTTTEAGKIGTPPNTIEPGKRPLSSMTPTLVFFQGQPMLITGAPGGRTIINTVLQVISNVIDFHMPIDEAVNAPRMHHQWLPDVIQFEKGCIHPRDQKRLRAMGYNLQETPLGFRMGAANSILMLNDQAGVIGVSDVRGQDGGVDETSKQ
ncbi:MAG: gamma-glutamyltransferase [Flavobacteriales bacterium]